MSLLSGLLRGRQQFGSNTMISSHHSLSRVRSMTAIVTETSKTKTPGRWWVTPDENMGMDVLVGGKYTPKDYPIITFGPTFLALRNCGNVYWGRKGIPTELDDKLRGRQTSLPHVNLVCLGADTSHYFVQFEDGARQWSGTLDNYLRGFIKGSTKITALAIGPNNSYYCQNDSGTEIYKNLPKGLQDALVGRKNRLPKVYNVNLGQNGEWFVRFLDGSVSYGGVTEGCDKRANEIKGDGNKVHEIIFGNDHTCMIRESE